MDATPGAGNGWYSEATATFGDRVTGAREALGLSQEELARRIGVRHRTVRAWEEDTAEPRANRLQMLAGLLNVSLRWLMTGEGDGPPEPDHAEVAPEMAALLAELRAVRTQLARTADRVSDIEQRLRDAARRAA